MIGTRVTDFRGEAFLVVAQHGDELTLRSLDNPGDPARFERADAMKDYNLLPAPEPLGADSSEQRVLRARDAQATIDATRGYAIRTLERERIADELGLDPEDLR
jgi:hypothetical protein